MIIENLILKVGKLEKLLNLKFSEGVYLIKGDNGVGKTTLMNKIIFENNFMIYLPEEAKQTFENERYNFVSYLPQNLPQINFQVKKFLKIKELNISLNEVYVLLDKFGLHRDILHKRFNKLSGGEQIKIGIISTLLKNTPFIFLDEPTNNLDNESVQNLKKVIESYFPTTTFVIITHDERLHDIATSFITLEDDFYKQEDNFNSNSKDYILQKYSYRPLKTALKFYLLPQNLVFLLSTISIVLMLTISNNYFLQRQYNYYNPPVDNIISLNSGWNDPGFYFSYEMFNKKVIDEFNINIDKNERGLNMNYYLLAEIFKTHGVNEILISDPIYWTEFSDLAYSEGLATTLKIINPPQFLWDGFTNYFEFLDKTFLIEGRFPTDGNYEVILSRLILEKYFDISSYDLDNPIGKQIQINGKNYEIVGIYQKNVVIISNNSEEIYGFINFDINNHHLFLEGLSTYRKNLDWWNQEFDIYNMVHPIFIFTEKGYEQQVLINLLENNPDASYFSHIFSTIYITQENRLLRNQVIRRMFISSLIIGITTIIPVFDLLKTLKFHFEYEKIHWFDSLKLYNNFRNLGWIITIGCSILISLIILLTHEFSTYLIIPGLISFILLNSINKIVLSGLKKTLSNFKE